MAGSRQYMVNNREQKIKPDQASVLCLCATLQDTPPQHNTTLSLLNAAQLSKRSSEGKSPTWHALLLEQGWTAGVVSKDSGGKKLKEIILLKELADGHKHF